MSGADEGDGGRSGAGPRVHEVPEGDNRPRLVCPDCGFINYENPKIVAGAVVTWQDKFLLCRRAINPRKGWWTIPAGYLELHETVIEGARREAMEEACATIDIDALLAIYTIPRISQVQMIFRATLPAPDFAAGEESLEVALFDWDGIPWDELAFPTVRWALGHYRETHGQTDFAPRGNPESEAHRW
jgi:ADP-ribose pyrophosphatase YjhB (NUDIX family)